MSTLQVRINDDLKNQATLLYDELGLDLSTAVRMFFKKSIAIQGIPFDVKIESKEKAKQAIKKMNDISQMNGNSKMSLEEINEEISKTRQER